MNDSQPTQNGTKTRRTHYVVAGGDQIGEDNETEPIWPSTIVVM